MIRVDRLVEMPKVGDFEAYVVLLDAIHHRSASSVTNCSRLCVTTVLLAAGVLPEIGHVK